jgi:hypothetical protein
MMGGAGTRFVVSPRPLDRSPLEEGIMPARHHTKPTDARFTDLTGRIFGAWHVLDYAGKNKFGDILWLCRCDCGTERPVRYGSLFRSKHPSCGCVSRRALGDRKRIHGCLPKGLYSSYCNMMSRCFNPRTTHYKDYGGRGITVVEAWKSNYVAFRDWALTHGYRDGLTIERKDVNGPYSPENCCWIPPELQASNTRRNRRLVAFGEIKAVSAWARDPRCKVKGSVLWDRIHLGWEPERAIVTPCRFETE